MFADFYYFYHLNTSPTCSTATTTQNDMDPPDATQKDIWPRFLIVEAADENIPLDMNEFVLKKAIDGMANGVPEKWNVWNQAAFSS